jgi:DNA processing protein
MKVDIIQIFISRIPTLSTSERICITNMFSSVKDLIKLNSRDLKSALGRLRSGLIFKPLEILDESESILNTVIKSDIDIIDFGSANYPPLLREIYNPPFLIYKRGADIRNIPSIAVVGTRRPTQTALRAAFNLGLEIADYDIYLVSGLAAGIDCTAHKGVLSRKGNTIAVLGNGIDFIYPSENMTLGQAIVNNGGIILSEYAPGTPPVKYNFPARNRIISGLCQSLVVVEAPEKSGALISAEFALDQGRAVYIHRCSLDSRNGAGCRQLLFDGADIITSFSDFSEFKEAV